MNRIFQEHRQRNADSRERWECFAGHRRRVTELLVSAGEGKTGRLCLLGAGNCNDLELTALLPAFTEVHLVDLDEGALAYGVAAQQLADTSRLHRHGGIDLAGCNEFAGGWRPDRPPPATDVERCLEIVAAHPAPQLPGPFDVVASVCLLTQLLDSLALSLGGNHPRFVELLTGVRLRHIRLLFELLKPGGTALLITDFVSSATCPSLATVPEEELPALAMQLINARNFFTGTNPAVLRRLFQLDAVVAPQVSQLDVSRPWRWDFGPRTYAVFAISARKQNHG